MRYKPRGEFVVIRETFVDTVGSLAMPNSSIHGKAYFVVAVGPKVEDLKEGDQVFMTGQKNVDWSFIPGTKDLVVIREGNIVLTLEQEIENG